MTSVTLPVVSPIPSPTPTPTRLPRFFYRNCTEVTDFCTVDATTYGYRPNLGANALFVAIFAILAIAHFPLAWKYKLRGYSFAIGGGCIIEAVGYGGRIMMNDNPWSDDGFRVQVVCLVVAPSFIAAGIYLTVKHLIIHFGPEYSKLKPRLYTWVFIGCDIFSIVIQATGGGVAAGGRIPSRIRAGNNLIIAGIAFQVVTMAACGLLSLDYALRYIRRSKAAGRPVNLSAVNRPGIFCITSVFAYTFVLIRCIYRIPEMAGGWGGPLMRHEAEFMVLDGVMIMLASILLTFSYPGFMFPEIMKSSKNGDISLSGSHSSSRVQEEK